MQTNESDMLYLRKELNVLVSLNSLATSYSEDRVRLDEIIIKDNKEYTFEELCAKDENLRNHPKIRPHLENIFNDAKKHSLWWWKIRKGNDGLYYTECLAIKEHEIEELQQKLEDSQKQLKNYMSMYEYSHKINEIIYEDFQTLYSIIKSLEIRFNHPLVEDKIKQEHIHHVNSLIESINQSNNDKLKKNTELSDAKKLKGIDAYHHYAEIITRDAIQKELQLQKEYHSVLAQLEADKEKIIAEIKSKENNYIILLQCFNQLAEIVARNVSSIISPIGKVIYKINPNDSQTKIPLYWALWKCPQKIHVNEVLAFYDDTWWHTGARGIIITINNILIFDDIHEPVTLAYTRDVTLKVKKHLFHKDIFLGDELIATFGCGYTPVFQQFIKSINKLCASVHSDFYSELSEKTVENMNSIFPWNLRLSSEFRDCLVKLSELKISYPESFDVVKKPVFSEDKS